MRIAINLIPFSSIQGIEIFSQNIISRLLESKGDNFFIFASENLPKILDFNNSKTIKINGLKRKYSKAVFQQFNIYSLIKKHKIDILFSPSPSAPFFYGNKMVVIHDCAYDRFPEFDNLLSKLYFKTMYYGAKYFSKEIITVSEFSKKELISLYKINPDKIKVIYEAVPELPAVDENYTQKILKKFGINASYFIYIGNNRPRKNIIGLLKAFKIFLEKTNQNFSFVIAGVIDKRFLDLKKEIKNSGLEGRVILTDFVSPEEKTALYKKAKALCFPSFYEGFGLPVLEAQSLGVPVLTSNTSSLPEVAGNGALFVDPYNINEIADGMTKIIQDENLREKLIKDGLENIKRFSWKKSAQQILNLLK